VKLEDKCLYPQKSADFRKYKHLSAQAKTLWAGFLFSLCRTKSRAIAERYRYFRQKKESAKLSNFSHYTLFQKLHSFQLTTH